MAVTINTLGMLYSVSKDQIDNACGVNIAPIVKIYELKSPYIFKQGIGSNSANYYKAEQNGETFYIQGIGIGIKDSSSLEAVHTMDYDATRIAVVRDNKTQKTLFSFPIVDFYVNDEAHRDENGVATTYQIMCRTCSRGINNNTSDLYLWGDYDVVIYEIEDINKQHTVVSTEKKVDVETYGNYNTVYNSTATNVVNLQDCKIVESDWDTLNVLSIGLDGNFIMYPCWMYGMSNNNYTFYPETCINTSAIKKTKDYVYESENDVVTLDLPEEFNYQMYENFFKLLIPKDRKMVKRAGLYTINLSGEYF